MVLIKNPLKLNDWGINSFLNLILAIQLSLLALICLDLFGFPTIILRQLTGFIYLTIVPGMILLRILGFHELGNTKTVLYAVGLSITTLMFGGFILSILAPYLRISQPLSFFPIILMMTLIVLILCVVSYFLDKKEYNPGFIDSKDLLSPKILFLCLIPFLSIFGTYLLNYYHTNIVIIFLILILALIIFLTAFDTFPKKLYPLIIFVIAISLLFQNSLVSNYISGFDIQREYFVANSVFTNFNLIDVGYPELKAILSVTILPTIFANVLNLNLIWVFKIIYPLLLTLIPLGLYKIIKTQTNAKIAFLSTLFFVSSYSFYYNMLQLTREIIGELFLILIIFLMLDEKNNVNKSVLLVIFAFSLIVSHYGLSYILLLILITAWLLNILLNNYKFRGLLERIKIRNINTKKTKINSIATNNFVWLYIIFVVAWYLYVSNSYVFVTILNIGNHIITTISTEFLNPASSQALNIIITKNVSVLNDIEKYLHITTIILISIGLMSQIFKFANKISINKDININTDYFLFAIGSFIVCIYSIVLPNFAVALDTIRIYQITLFFLAPFAVIGGIVIIKGLTKILKRNEKNVMKNSFRYLSIFFIIFLFFNSGLVQEVMHAPYSPTFSLTTVDNPPVFSQEEVSSAQWFSEYADGSFVYGDTNAFVLLNSFLGSNSKQMSFSLDTMSFLPLKKNSYIYLRTIDLKGVFLVSQYYKNQTKEDLLDKSYLNNILIGKNKIYDDGSNIYL